MLHSFLTNNFKVAYIYFSFHSNWGSESDPELKYHTGNSEPRGYGIQPLFFHC
jgi:hypothetical protein